MAALEPVMAFLAIVAPLALVGVLVEWVARRRSHPKTAPAAGAQRKTGS